MNRIKASVLLFIVQAVMLYRVLVYGELQQTGDIDFRWCAIDTFLVVAAIGSVVYLFESIIKEVE